MSEETTKRGPRDHKLIALQEDYEVRYWTEALGVTREELETAVKAVGHSADKVRAYVRDSAK